MQVELPEAVQNIGVCLSRIKKVNKFIDEKDEKNSEMNKLISKLFIRVTDLAK